jgi:hypothetical protein
MSDPEDIVDKADAFLGRYRPAAAGDVPVLTDVVDGPGASPAAGERPIPAPAPARLSEAQLRDLERQVTQRVIEAIQPALSALLEQARGALTEQYRAQAETIVREAVAKALEQEIRRLRPPGA